MEGNSLPQESRNKARDSLTNCTHHQHLPLCLREIDIEHTGVTRIVVRHSSVVNLRLTLRLQK